MRERSQTKSKLSDLFDKIEKQCADLNKIHSNIIESCDEIQITITKTKQTSDKLSQQVKEL